jgi:Signal transduction histidine kinase
MLLFAKGGDNKVVKVFTVEQLFNEFEPMVDAVIQGHNVDFAINSDDESLPLLGNPNALASALSNLVVNAVQVAGKGCQVVVDSRQQGDSLLLSVADSGPGIAPELQAKVLEPFFTTRQQGTGLGLAVVQMVCHAHEGKLTLQSEPEKGACFTLCLPLAKGGAAEQGKSVGETQ